MGLLNQYVLVPNQLAGFFERIREGQAPETFTRQHLKDIGFASSNHRAFIPLLKGLGFLTSDGTPTERYKQFLDPTRHKQVLGEAIAENYGDIFQIKANPTKSDKAAIAGKYKSTYNVSENTANNLATTFFALYEIADQDVAKGAKPSDAATLTPAQGMEVPKAEIKPSPTSIGSADRQAPPMSLSYNLQIHLPATKDIEVYNAIFKSIRTHLIDK